MSRSNLFHISILVIGLAGACGDDTGSEVDSGSAVADARPGSADASNNNNGDIDAGDAGDISDAGDTPDAIDPGDISDAGDTPDAIDPGDAGDTPDAIDPIDPSDAGEGDTDAAPLPGHLILVEVFYEQTGSVDDQQWVKLYNPTRTSIDLSGYALGWGGSDYTVGTLQLTGTLAPNGCFVVGGPSSVDDNGNPVYDQTVDLVPDLNRGSAVASGVALFELPADQIEPGTVPLDAVLYGIGNVKNTNNLIDETGAVGAIDARGAAANQSIYRIDSGPLWEVKESPTPNECPPFDDPSV